MNEVSVSPSPVSTAAWTDPSRGSWSGGLWGRAVPALLVLVGGWMVLFLRGPLPLDEIRYTEVLREMLSGSKYALTLNGEAYSHKTPLLFWFAWAAHSLGASLWISLMIWPPIFSSAVVLVGGSLGRRLSLRHVEWILASMVLPMTFAGVVLFDALLSLSIWLFLWARFSGRGRLAMAASVPMMMAKGPAALVFALPYGWALSPPRAGAKRGASNLLLQLLPGLAVLGLWAYFAILRTGTDSAEGSRFAAELAWGQTAGRVVNSFAHARPVYWYVPAILIATLPYALLLLRPLRRLRCSASGVEESRYLHRLALASLVVFVVWSLISGKQIHYLLPMMPALALLFAAELQEQPGLTRRVRVAGGIFLVLLVLLLLYMNLGGPGRDPLAFYGELADAMRADRLWRSFLWAAVLVGGGAAWVLLRGKGGMPKIAILFGLGFCVIVLPFHRGSQILLSAHTFLEEPYASELRERPLVTVGNPQAGFYNLFFERDRVDFIETGKREEIEAWCRAHPQGILLIKAKNLSSLEGLPLQPLVRDRFRGAMNQALRVNLERRFDPQREADGDPH